MVEAIELTGLFIKDGPVVQVRNRNDKVEIYDDQDDEVFYDGPLAVLINRYSASASEIFSGAIQDYKRGVILGENTFGKGTVQNLIDLDQLIRESSSELGQIKMTLAKFYRVTGSSTQNIGVQPDVKFPSPYDGESFGESGMPNALPWDEIKSTTYSRTNSVDENLLKKLNKVYQKHLEEDTDLQQLSKEVEKAKLNRNTTSISLNLQVRKNEQGDQSEEMNTTVDQDEVQEDSTDEVSDKLSKDPYLKEGLRLLAELSRNKVG